MSDKLKNALIFFLAVILFFSVYLNAKAFQHNNDLQNELNQTKNDLRQKETEFTILTESNNITLRDIVIRKSDIRKCVEPYIPVIRNVAVSQAASAPPGIDSDNETWKIWIISRWVTQNINYVSDPSGFDYYSLASETMLIRAGDCEDFAILTASMYESVGLDAAIVEVDSDNDTKGDHMACAVYYHQNAESYINDERIILQRLNLVSTSGDLKVMSFEADQWELLKKYTSGTWIIIDPLAAKIPGYISASNYQIISAIDVGGLLPYILPD